MRSPGYARSMPSRWAAVAPSTATGSRAVAAFRNLPWCRVVVMAGSRFRLVAWTDRAVIPPEQVTLLFQPFQRMPAAHNGRAGDRGLGLGLSIVEAITAAHGAHLT